MSRNNTNNTENIFNDIQKLQKEEKKLFYDLEQYGISDADKNKIIQKINQITQIRMDLYKLLADTNFYMDSNVKQSDYLLKDQKQAIGIVENELDEAKKKLSSMKDEKLNKLRLVQLNRYYSDRYYEHSNLFKVIIFTMIPVLLIILLFKQKLINETIFNALLVIVLVIGGVYFLKQLFSILSRNNMNYREFNWYFNPSDAPKNTTFVSSSVENPWSVPNLGTCVGEFCCSKNTTYDKTLNQCVPNTSDNASSVASNASTISKEGFKNNMLDNFLNNYAYAYKKPDATLNSDFTPAVSKSSIYLS